MRCTRTAGPVGNENGNALVGALLFILVLTSLGTLYLGMARTDTDISGHARRHTQAEFQAEAGLAEGLARMSLQVTNPNYFGEDLFAIPPTPGWGRYISLAAGNWSEDPDVDAAVTDSLDNDDDGDIDEDGETYPEVLTAQSGSDQVNYPWVKVRYKLNAQRQVLRYGDHDNNPSTAPVINTTTGSPVIVASAEGARGSARRRVEVEAVRLPMTTPRAAIYTESDDFQFNGTQFLVSGKDWDPATGDSVAGAPPVPGIETTRNPGNIAGDLSGHQLNNVEGSGGNPSVRAAAFDYDLPGLVDAYKDLADIVHDGGTISNGSAPAWGGLDEYHIVHVTDDLHISGSTVGGGLLILEGDLTVSGSFTWYGMILNLGTITFTGGGNDIHIYGAVMSSGGVSRNSVGGQADILFSSRALSRLSGFNPYKPMSWTELPS